MLMPEANADYILDEDVKEGELADNEIQPSFIPPPSLPPLPPLPGTLPPPPPPPPTTATTQATSEEVVPVMSSSGRDSTGV